MISVLTLTYQRHHILEEAIQSFLEQKCSDIEMVVINDSPEVRYKYSHPQVTIINHPTRFSSVGKKLEWGYKQCKYPFVYRLDDDDLLGPNALEIVKESIINNQGFDIYRSDNHYFFHENKFKKMGGSINNGNVYSKDYLNRIKFPELSGDEDLFITFRNNAKIFTVPKPTMIYRWGMNTYHISGMGIQPTDKILAGTDRLIHKETGEIDLHPRFVEDHYSKLPK